MGTQRALLAPGSYTLAAPRVRRAAPLAPVAEYIDRYPLRAFAVLSAFYIAVVAALSSLKLLWLDELITLHIAALGSLSSIWRALEMGVDLNPPATYLLVHASRSLFGASEFADRLPAALGYWAGMLCLFLYLRRRIPGTWAIGGTVLSMAMAAFDYSYESRSYGLMYGLAMIAFYCWSRKSDNTLGTASRRAYLAAMTLSLALGISTNYFAVLAFLPIAAAEAVRTYRAWSGSLRSASGSARAWPGIAIDVWIWLALAIAATPLIFYRPLIEHSIREFAPYAWNRVSIGQVFDSYTEMVEIVLYPILALFLFSAAVRGAGRLHAQMCGSCRIRISSGWLGAIRLRRIAIVPPEEAVGIFCFMLYPFLGYVLASVHGGMLSPRFVIPVCYGFAISAAFTAFQLFGAGRRAAPVFLSLVLLWFVCRESYVGYCYEQQKQSMYDIIDGVSAADYYLPANAPIVIPDPLLAPTFAHYAPWRLASRVVLPVDFPAIRYYRHDDSPEQNLWAGRNLLYEFPIVPLADLHSNAKTYLVVAGRDNWLLSDLRLHLYPFARLPVDLRDEGIGGFTPLARGVPAFYAVSGDRKHFTMVDSMTAPVPFRRGDNLPNASPLTLPGTTP